jgi:hypothetical protein
MRARPSRDIDVSNRSLRSIEAPGLAASTQNNVLTGQNARTAKWFHFHGRADVADATTVSSPTFQVDHEAKETMKHLLSSRKRHFNAPNRLLSQRGREPVAAPD